MLKIPLAANEVAQLVKPSGAYRKRAWLAVLALLAFLVVYLVLACWFTYTSYRMMAGAMAGGEGSFFGFVGSILSGFFAVFMWKALLLVRGGKSDEGEEITADDQPKLFEFLYQLSDEIGAPRPHRVFLTQDVNAFVSYEITILSFFFPSKKNLTIGLGLINSLNQTEFKAVLAHEFGHFAQKTMAVGRWVYVAERIAGHIVFRRDWLDQSLAFLSSIDIRIAWIGWIMSLIVWSIRSVMEMLFRIVMLFQRALSQEMEFQADLVAVSVTGSDALIHALFKLQAADEDWDRTIAFANQQVRKKHLITDLYVIQAETTRLMQGILCDPTHGIAPPIPSNSPETHRVFTRDLAQPPHMWATHPASSDREENAKRTYISSDIDESPAWEIFRDYETLRRTLTDQLTSSAKLPDETVKLTDQEAIEELRKTLSAERFKAKYRGNFLGRHITRYADSAEDVYTSAPKREEIRDLLAGLYPESLSHHLSLYRNLEDELGLLKAIQSGNYQTSSKVIEYRGEKVTRSEFPKLIQRVESQRDQELSTIEQHDQLCRSVHDAAARYGAYGWQDYLRSLVGLLHFVEQSLANAEDAHRSVASLTAVVFSGSGRVSERQINQLIDHGTELQRVLSELDFKANEVQLPQAVLDQLDVQSWREMLTKFELPLPDRENIGQWLQVVDSWALPFLGQLRQLRDALLDYLLQLEEKVANAFVSGIELESAPKSIPTVTSTRKFTRGSERSKEHRLGWWQRFVSADGRVAGTLRTAVACSILAAIVIATTSFGTATVYVYNGLPVAVNVSLNGKTLKLEPNTHSSARIGAAVTCQVECSTIDGVPIESFQVSAEKGFATYVYNVASAAPMIEWTAVYGDLPDVPTRNLGCPRWRTTSANHVFSEPPRQLKTSSSGGTRLVLEAVPNVRPIHLGLITNPREQRLVIWAQAKWTKRETPMLGQWLRIASTRPGFDEILDHRLRANPNEVASLLWRQESASDEELESIADDHRSQAAEKVDSPGWQFLVAHLIADIESQDQAMFDGFKKWPNNHWFAHAAGKAYSRRGEWERALECYQVAAENYGPMHIPNAFSAARVQRLVAGGADLAQLKLESFPTYQTYLEIEKISNAQEFSPELFAFAELHRGKVRNAESVFDYTGSAEYRADILVLLASSEGTRDALRSKAMRLEEDEELGEESLFYLVALAHRLGEDTEPFIRKLREEHQADMAAERENFEQVLSTLLMLLDNAPDEEFELKGLTPFHRGVLMVCGIILYPEQVPDSWRDESRLLLFPTERPWFANSEVATISEQ